MNAFRACSIVEGFSGETHTGEEVIAAWQSLIDSGLVWQLRSWYGLTAIELMAEGFCHSQESVANRQAKSNAATRRNSRISISRQR